MKYTYNYVMMDAKQFAWYEKHCKRNNIKCNYSIINTNCYGVMIAQEKSESKLEVEKTEDK